MTPTRSVSRPSSSPSTTAVARASSSARCDGRTGVPKKLARVASFLSGTSCGVAIRCLASRTVSSTSKPGQAHPMPAHAAVRNAKSNGALCAASTLPSANASKPGSTAATGGADVSIWSLIPVSSVIAGGTGVPGLTSEPNSAINVPPCTRTAPISVMAASSGAHPVVSTSTTVKSRSASGTDRMPGTGIATSAMITTVRRPTDISAPDAPAGAAAHRATQCPQLPNSIDTALGDSIAWRSLSVG